MLALTVKAHRCSFAIDIVYVLPLLALLILTHKNGNHHHYTVTILILSTLIVTLPGSIFDCDTP